MSQKIIEFKNVTYSYQKNDYAIENLSLKISRDKTIGIVGSNGAGKSTLLKLLVGLIQANSGEVVVDGIVSTKKTIEAIRRKIGFAFQDAESQLFMTTVYEDVAFGPRNQELDEVEVDKCVKEALLQVDALHLINRPPYKLSGGEKRSVALATVLAMDPEIIILDEPTTGLDPWSRRNLIGILESLDHTKIIATHDMDMTLSICDEVIVMHKGQIVDVGKPEEIFKNKELLKACHLEQPLSLQGCLVCNRSL